MWLLSIVLIFCNFFLLFKSLNLTDPQNILSESCRLNLDDMTEESEDMCEGSDEEEDNHDKEPCFHEDFTPPSKKDD